VSVAVGRQIVTIRRSPGGGDGWNTSVADSDYTTTARGSLPTTWQCEIQPMTGTETASYGVTENDQAFELFGRIDPQVGPQDVLDFTLNGRAHTNVRVTIAEDVAGLGRQWRVVAIERGAVK
jgi:hypothetical protein